MLEDFLEPAGITLDEFVGEFTGSWMFGYADALRSAGVDMRIVGLSTGVQRPWRTTHAPTGTALSLLPAPRAFTAVRDRAADLYARSGSEAFPTGPLSLPGVRATARELAAYASTPLRRLTSELRLTGTSAVLCQEYEFPRFDVAWLTTRLLGIPLFASFQGGDYQRYRLERVVRPRTIVRAAGLIVATATEAERVRRTYGVAPSRIHRVFNPVDLETWRPLDGAPERERLGIPPDALVVGWHGRVSIAQKGLDVLLDAWRRLSGSWTGSRPLRLLLVGSGQDSAALADGLATRGLGDEVVWVDRLVADRSELASLLSTADVYALPSRHEGFPVALVEAIACGLPAVAADANGVPDILERGEESGGIVVPRGDAAALAQALCRVLGDDRLRAALAGAARARAEGAFSHAAVGEELRRLLLAGGDEPA